jgi:peptidoglycan/LPS O-acetylase OafA/YrhL
MTRPDVAPPQTRRARRQRFRGDIEGLRAVAVLLVVAFHAGVSLVSGGFVGVDVFFVLSGFLITGLLVDEVARTGTISLSEFYARRIRRLLPLSTLVLAATAVAVFLFIPPIDRKGIAADLVGAALWGANWRFASESTQYMADTDKSPVLHFWSLSVEEQFYVVWPLLLLLLAGRSGLAKRAWSVVFRRIGLTLGVVVVASLVVSWQLSGSGSPFAYFGLHTRAWELGIGAALALARPVLPLLTRRAAWALSLTGLGAIVASALLMDESTPFPGTAALVPVLGTAALIAAGARLPDEGVSRALSHPVPRYIGRVSYAWYLWHWPVLVIANARFGAASTGVAADGTSAATHASWPVVLAAVALSFGLAVASHYLVEQPMRQASALKASRRRSMQFGGALVAASLIGAGGLTVAGAAGQGAGEQARQDTPQILKECNNGVQTVKVPPAEDCRLGPVNGKRKVALIGDSHSQHWQPALKRLAEERGWTVYVFMKNSCTVSDVPIWIKQNKAEYTACADWRSQMLDRVGSIEDLDAVVVGRWMDYRSLALNPDGSRTTPETVGAVWKEGSARSFARLASAAPRILVIRDVPRPDVDVPACLSKNGNDASKCDFPRAGHTYLDEPLAKAERAAAPKAVRFVDLTERLCPDDTCPVMEDGKVIYRDNHHLTMSFSETLAEPLRKAIEAAL